MKKRNNKPHQSKFNGALWPKLVLGLILGACLTLASTALGADGTFTFATGGDLPIGVSVTVDFSYEPAAVVNTATTFNSPGPSDSFASKNNRPVTYTYPASLAANGASYLLVGTTLGGVSNAGSFQVFNNTVYAVVGVYACNDTQPPVIGACPAAVSVPATAGQCAAQVTYTKPTATDDCSIPTVACSPASGTAFPVGESTVTCTATDAANTTASCSFSVTVVDTQPPTIDCPQNISAPAAPGQCTEVATYSPTATDNCPGVLVVCSPLSGTAFAKGTTTVNCTATDAAGLTATCSFTVTIVDTQPPTIACPANVVLPAAAGQCAAVATYSLPTASDNCSGVGATSCTPASGSTFPKGTSTVICTANDAAGLTGSCTFTVTVNDTQLPVLDACPGNISTSAATGQCTAVVNFPTPGATDNCPGLGATVCIPASGSAFPVGTSTVTCTVTDAGGLPKACSFTVTVMDEQAPEIACPASFSVPAATGQCSAVVTYATPSGSDNCPGVTVVCVPPSGSVFQKTTTTVTCTATDAGLNPTSCAFTITVMDTQPPVIGLCPANIPVSAGGGNFAVVNYTNPTAQDNCPGVNVSCSPASGSTFQAGDTLVTCTARDGADLTATCTFTVTVNDTVKPVIGACPVNINQNTDLNKCAATVTFTKPTAQDNFGVVTVACAPPSGSDFPKGTTKVTCTATDGVGLQDSCQFDITVIDNQAPVALCPANITQNADSGACDAVVIYTIPVPTDNCPGATTSCTPPSGSVFPVGLNTVTCTATDAVGKTGTCSFTVTVQDITAPTITCPAVWYLIANAAGTAALPDLTGQAVTQDDCDDTVTVTQIPTGSTLTLGTTQVTLTAQDDAGNTADCIVNVIVLPMSAATSAAGCPLDIPTCADSTGFRLIFTPDVQNLPSFKLFASNPGQFAYNIFAKGAKDATMSFTITIPDDFVGQGALPVAVYSDVVYDSGQCLVPAGEPILSQALPDDGIIRVTVPASGLVFISIHLDFAAKKTTGYTRDAAGNALQNALIVIPNCATYTFGVTGAQTDTDTIQSVNEFKKNPGVAGQVVSDCLDTPTAGAVVTLSGPGGTFISTTDADGFYQIVYKHKGKPAYYTLSVAGHSPVQVLLKGNAFFEVNFGPDCL